MKKYFGYSILVCILFLLGFLVIDWRIYPYSDKVQKISFFLKRNVITAYNIARDQGFSKVIDQIGKVEISNNIETVFGLQHHLSVKAIDLRTILNPWVENGLMSPGYFRFIKDGPNLLIVTGDGRVYLFDGMNAKALESNLHKNIKDIRYSSIDTKTGEDLSKRLGVKGIHFDSERNLVYVAYHKLLKQPNCYTMGVDVGKVLFPLEKIEFIDYFKGSECKENFNGHESGGKLAKIRDELLLTIGTFDSNQPQAQGGKSEMGSVVEIRNQHKAKILANGLRNTQGLVVARDNVFITSQGPMGGDIFSKVQAGDNFGYPSHSYGFAYEYRDVYKRPMAPQFTEPTFYFTPSIATSPLLFYEKPEFPRFDGKFIIGSLKNRALHIMDYDFMKDRVMSVEEYTLGYRVRDLEADNKGLLYALTDEGFILVISRASSDMKDPDMKSGTKNIAK